MHSGLHALRRDPALALSLLVLALLVTLAVFPWLATATDPSTLSAQTLRAPSPVNLLGTDELGRDIYAMMVYGIRISLLIGSASAAIATSIGIIAGCMAGYFGGIWDRMLMAVSEAFQVLPVFIIAAVIVALLGAGIFQVILVIAFLAWPKIARVMRAEVMRIRELEFVDALRCLGKSDREILFFNILPNAVAPAVPLAMLVIAQAIMLEASLSFLGLSSTDVFTWGKLLNSGQRFIFNAWWLSIFPGLALLITVLAFNLAGDALVKHLDPRTRYSG